MLTQNLIAGYTLKGYTAMVVQYTPDNSNLQGTDENGSS